MLVKVDNNSIRKMRSHMHEFFHGPAIGCILGTNGYIWIHSLCKEDEVPTVEERRLMATLRNSILALERAKVPIFKDTIEHVLNKQADLELEPKQMVENYEELTVEAKAMIEEEISQKKPINFDKLLEQIEQGDFVDVEEDAQME